jgi:hypothetical protein
MKKYIIDADTLEDLGDSIRSVTGSTKKFTPEEMIEEVRSILDATTFILVDQNGNEYPAVYVDSDTVCTATANDIRKGTVAVTPEGVIEGTKEIPAYYTAEGSLLILPGREFKLTGFKRYEFTKLQVLICAFKTSASRSVVTEKVSINGKVYPVNSAEVLSEVTTDAETMSIILGVVNDSNVPYVMRYFTYKEEY